MRKLLLALAAVALVPAYGGAQVAATPPAVSIGTTAAPRGPDTPVATVPGAAPVQPANIDLPLPSVDSSGANRSNSSTTGEAKPPVGAPRLPGEPMNPPTGPDE